MARKFLTALDLNKNELQNVRLQNLGSDPGSPVAGQLYYNSGDNTFRGYNGTNFKALLRTGEVVNADINAAAAIAYSKLNLATSIVNADIAAGAAIALSKLATDPLARANHTGSQTASTISDFDTQVRTSRLDQLASPTSAVGFNSQRITNVADPTGAQDSATKAYVDAVVQGLDAKASVRLASTTNVNITNALENGDTVDGIVIATGNRVLLMGQTAPEENGIYDVPASGAASRSSDANSWNELVSAFVFVEDGTNADNGFVSTVNTGGTLGTTAVTFTQFSGAGQITAGAGLTKNGNTLDVVGTTNRISVSADAIDISSSYIGQASITTLGTITTGVWNGTTIAVANGGTGATDVAGARTSLGANGKYAVSVGDGSATSYTVTHNLNTRDVVVTVYEVGSPYAEVLADVEHATVNTVTAKFTSAPTTDQYRVVVEG